MSDLFWNCKDVEKQQKILSFFWNWVSVKEENECWEWIGAKHCRDKYGQFTYRIGDTKRTIISPRFSLELSLGRSLRKGYECCHKCNNRACCNPNHLYEGTHMENQMDKLKSNTWGFKLNLDDVRAIKASKKTNVELAQEYNVSSPLISKIKSGSRWNIIERISIN